MKKQYWMLGLILLFTIGTRLFFAFQSPEFSDDHSYFVLRQVEHISSTGLPLYQDDLSYGGREFVMPVLFYYLLAFFDLFMPLHLAAKIIPNLLIASVAIIIYLISKEITDDVDVSLVTSFVSSFIPVLLAETVNNLSAYTLAIPLMLLCIYFLMLVKKNRRYALYFILSLVALSLTHGLVVILPIGLVIYALILKSEGIKQDKAQLELILFSIVFVLWAVFLTFKKALIAHGAAAITQNIPQALISTSFADFTLASAIYFIGIVPTFQGVYMIYKYIFKERNMELYLIISFCLSVTILLWLNLVPIRLGLILLGAFFTILFSKYYTLLFNYLSKTRIAWITKYYLALIILVLLITSFFPAIVLANNKIMGGFSEEDIEAFTWLGENTPEDAVVLSSLDDGSLIPYFANRKNVIDSEFLLIDNIDARLGDVEILFKTPYETEAIGLLTKYDVDYILLTPRTKAAFGITSLGYTSNEDCFRQVYNNSIQIYQSLCRLEQQ